MLSTIEPFGDSDVVDNGETGVIGSDTEVIGKAVVSLTVNDVNVFIEGKIGVDMWGILLLEKEENDGDVSIGADWCV